MRVKTSKTLLVGFRHRALRAWPSEYGELLYGACNRQCINITEFVIVPHVAGPEHFWFDVDKVALERPSGKYLGTIHTHCDTCDASMSPIPSQSDWEIAIRHKEVIHAVCHVHLPPKKPRTAFYFYLGLPAALDLICK